MDLTGLTALDVAIGLAFLFFLLSTICSTINEGIAGLLGWRAQELEKALRTYLEGAKPNSGKSAVDEFFAQPRIAALIDHERNRKKKRRSPSYLPSRAVALTLLDTFVDEQGQKSRNLQAPADEIAAKIPVEPLRTVVLDAIAHGRTDLDEIRQDVERSFDAVMDRCSGWYKRRAQKMILVIAALVTLGLNVNTFTVADRLAKDDALRASVVAQAGKEREEPDKIADQVDDVKELGLPMGWNAANLPEGADWAWKWLGWVATIAAVSLGAPFWFDVLGKFARLRNTGKREGTEKDPKRGALDRDEPPAPPAEA